MNQNQLLDLLEKDARLRPQDLADILNENVEDVSHQIKELEDKKIICGYHTVINYNRAQRNEKVMAYIEVSCSPQRNRGYDQTAMVIANYPEVTTMYLWSGECDFLCVVEGKTMFEVARFVSDSIACVDGVISTKTLFVLKQYKESGVLMESIKEDDTDRLVVTP